MDRELELLTQEYIYKIIAALEDDAAMIRRTTSDMSEVADDLDEAADTIERLVTENQNAFSNALVMGEREMELKARIAALESGQSIELNGSIGQWIPQPPEQPTSELWQPKQRSEAELAAYIAAYECVKPAILTQFVSTSDIAEKLEAQLAHTMFQAGRNFEQTLHPPKD